MNLGTFSASKSAAEAKQRFNRPTHVLSDGDACGASLKRQMTVHFLCCPRTAPGASLGERLRPLRIENRRTTAAPRQRVGPGRRRAAALRIPHQSLHAVARMQRPRAQVAAAGIVFFYGAEPTTSPKPAVKDGSNSPCRPCHRKRDEVPKGHAAHVRGSLRHI